MFEYNCNFAKQNLRFLFPLSSTLLVTVEMHFIRNHAKPGAKQCFCLASKASGQKRCVKASKLHVKYFSQYSYWCIGHSSGFLLHSSISLIIATSFIENLGTHCFINGSKLTGDRLVLKYHLKLFNVNISHFHWVPGGVRWKRTSIYLIVTEF